MSSSNQGKLVETFDGMGLSEEILRGIYSYGFENPSLIQKMTIPHIVSGRDVIGQAPSGCGKTAAFTVGLLSKIDPSVKELQGMILAPTRELTIQIHRVLMCLGDYLNLTIGLMIGGQSDVYTNNAQVIVGTVGRVIDNIQNKRINLETLKMFVLDETDEMLSEGFLEQMKFIVNSIPSSSQIAIFSATFPPEVLDLSKRFMNNPVEVLVKPEDLTLEGINQYKVMLRNDREKLICLVDIFPKLMSSQVIIYCNSVKKLDMVANELRNNNFDFVAISGDMKQKERNQIMEGFRVGSHRILLSTNVLARGIDVQQVSIVVNYELPKDPETYLHRIGRSGRFGRRGIAVNLVGRYEQDLLDRIERHYAIKIGQLMEDSLNQ
jgi:superfamily II DNA/RNA helicase